MGDLAGAGGLNILSQAGVPQLLQQTMISGVPFPMVVSLPTGGSPSAVDQDLKQLLPLQSYGISPDLLAQLQSYGLAQLVQGAGANGGSGPAGPGTSGREGREARESREARKRMSSDDGGHEIGGSGHMSGRRASHGVGRRASSPGGGLSPRAGLDEDGLLRSGGRGSKASSSKPTGMRGMCQVEGCQEDLAGLRDYHQRYKVGKAGRGGRWPAWGSPRGMAAQIRGWNDRGGDLLAAGLMHQVWTITVVMLNILFMSYRIARHHDMLCNNTIKQQNWCPGDTTCCFVCLCCNCCALLCSQICEYHLKIGSVIRDGKPQRFCQQCGRFQNLNEFDGNKRSCRAR